MARIFQTVVPALFPPDGAVRVMLFGEAPGPRGADQSGIPFWGDRAGLLVYRALENAGLARVPAEAYGDWDGARFRELGLLPVLHGAALSNAFPSCPTKDGHSFRAPTDRELKSEENLVRLRQELSRAQERCAGPLRVITLGKRAQFLFGSLLNMPGLDLQSLPHPSAQGLLQDAPGKGKGLRLADLQVAWEARLFNLLVG